MAGNPVPQGEVLREPVPSEFGVMVARRTDASSERHPAATGSDPRGEPGRDSLIEVRLRSDRLEDGFTELLSSPRAGIRLIACRPSSSRRGRKLVRWLELETTTPVGRERLRQLVRRAGNSDLSVATPGPDRALVRLSSPLPDVCASVFASGAMCVSCPLLSAGDGESVTSVRVLVPRNGEARRLRHELARRLDGRVTIERAGAIRTPSRLTPRQEQAFRTALELGYFSYPRRADLGTVARALGVGRSTALELIRHAIEQFGERRYPPAGKIPDRDAP